ncbi:MAG: hypothetical protein KDN19_16970 [Verrucomicrobiae bacterium]|nr:hypothetical protein [Verrucomicrobiae bacterium]
MPEKSFNDSPFRRLFSLPGVMLILANLIPLVGAVAWGWKVFDIVVLYWFENVVIGVINLLKMLICSPDPDEVNLRENLQKRIDQRRGSSVESQREATEAFLDEHQGKFGCAHHASKLFFLPFFTIHYGLFTTVHGMFVFSLLGENGSFFGPGGPFDALPGMVMKVFEGGGVWAALALTASHTVSFIYNFIIQREYRRVTVPQLMFAPYSRVIVLHIAILGGAFAIQALGSPVFLLVILVVGKIAIDLGLHFRAHRKVQSK